MTRPGGLRVLVVATKCPWPPMDGGRLVLAETLRALAGAGAEITLICPPAPAFEARPGYDPMVAAAAVRTLFVPRRLPPWPATLLRATPATIVRQTDAGALAAVERLLATERFDVAHAEQLQALPMLEPARRRGIPVVLRAQNVESDLWAGAARVLPIGAPWLLLQAALLRRWEGRAVARASATAALTARDAARLRALAAGRGRVVHLPAPFPASLPAAATAELEGDPALVLAAGGWIPNRDGARWFVRRVWPSVRERLPAARIHLFGGAGAAPSAGGVYAHPAPADSAQLFPAGAIHVVALRVASGVRMKILEAWARGATVVATAAAAAGLEEEAQEAAATRSEAPTPLLVGASAGELADAICTAHQDRELVRRLAGAGRDLLARRHDPAAIAADWLDLYRDLGTPSASRR